MKKHDMRRFRVKRSFVPNRLGKYAIEIFVTWGDGGDDDEPTKLWGERSSCNRAYQEYGAVAHVLEALFAQNGLTSQQLEAGYNIAKKVLVLAEAIEGKQNDE